MQVGKLQTTRGLAVIMAAALLVTTMAPAVVAGPSGMKWGMNVPAADALTEAGAKPDYAKMWVGAWTDGSWGSVENRLADLKSDGITPVIQWYYWGDDISPECVENGCWSDLHNAQKNKGDWYRMTHELRDVIRKVMGDEEVVVILETEFNKNGIASRDYAPTFDAYLARQSGILKNDTGARTVVGFGSWYADGWDRFDDAVAAADYAGFMALRSSVRQTETQYLGVVDHLVDTATLMQDKFPGKPLFITDLGFSSYTEPEYAEHQDTVIRELFERLPELKQLGVEGFLYRHLFDAPMDTNNYHGEAERWWGLRHRDGSPKPAYESWLQGVGATPPAAIAVPAMLPAEEMRASAGGWQSDSRASTGASWNLWSNGYLSERVDADTTGTYRFEVRARGSPAAGEWAHMEVRLDHGTVLGSWSVDTREYRTYTAEATLQTGDPVELNVYFTNDKRTADEDRNLVVDKVDVIHVTDAPVADFTWDADGRTVRFDASGSSDPQGENLSYAWDLGDGTHAAGREVSHAYDAGGAYTVTLTVDDGNSSATTTRDVQVNRPPAADFTWDADGRTLRFDASGSSDPDGGAMTYAWQLGDGTTASGSAVTHAYDAGGTYNVTLTVDDGEARRSATREVRVNHAPAAAFAWTADELTVHLDASNTSDEDGDALSYAWDLGDGTRAAGREVTHRYDGSGTYDVTLTVDDGGETVTTRETVTIEYQAPFDATFNPRNGNEWWIQTDVDANDALAGVDARVDGGNWKALKRHDWGWARSIHAPQGSVVEFRATSANGDVVRSIEYAWPSGEPAFSAGFSPYNGNEWWVQVLVDADKPLAGVDARVDGGAWEALQKRNWGWAKSMHAPDGSVVEFRARASDGSAASSPAYYWTSGERVDGNEAFSATFNPRNGGDWWVQTDVAANKDVVAVDARVDGGTWKALDQHSWGWAKSMHAPKGSTVEFRATSAGGDVVRSQGYTWPQ